MVAPPVMAGPMRQHEFTNISKETVVQNNPTKLVEIPLTVDSLLRLRSLEMQNEPIVAYPSTGVEYVNYSPRQLDIFAHRVALTIATIIPSRTSSSSPEVVVGLLGPSNFTYFITMLALTKLGHTVLFLSTRLSKVAYVSLLETTGASNLMIDDSFRNMAAAISADLPQLTVSDIIGKDVFDFPIKSSETHTRLDLHLDAAREAKKIAWIIHSSGSTGLPKPIYQTHSAALKNYTNNMNMRGFITLPLYHAHGISSLFRSLYSKKQIYLYNASLPMTHDYLLKVLQSHEIEIFYGVPYALKILGETSEGIQALANLKAVMFGGSACPDTLGDRLVENGVNLISHYGTTETGQLMTSFRPTGDTDWNYVRASVDIQPYLQWEARSESIYELVVLDGLTSKVASNRPDGSYATKDLFTPHPSTPHAWKYYARSDDSITLINGEKTVPASFEQAIRDNITVKEAVVFGNGKPRVGLMIVPSAATEGMDEQAIVATLRPVLKTANEIVPAYAKISADMIRILPTTTQYPRTDKGTVIRAAFYKQFHTEIDAVYEASEKASGELCLSEEELKSFLRNQMVGLLSLKEESALEDDSDFFSFGVDSLQAIQLRGLIAKNIQTNGQALGSNLVFDFPTVNSLARHLYCLRTGAVSEKVSVEEQMSALITKYGTFEQHVPVNASSAGCCVVVTGATGSLGAHVTAQLARRADIDRVYCLVRASSKAAANLRVIESLRARSLHHNLPLSARQKIVSLPSNFAKSDLGLGNDLFDLLTMEVTAVAHCAWSVNFNLGLGSFEADCIAGAHNLIRLCLKAKRPAPASFNFCSSVSAVAATKEEIAPEALPLELSYAQGMGYAQSKLVTEHICSLAAAHTGIQARVLRVGQVIGDTVQGIWNATEAIPMILQGAMTIGVVPKLDEKPLWLPVDTVASAVTDISLSDTDARIMNVVSHQSFHWTRDLLPALHSAGLEFEELDQQEWIQRLRSSNPDPVANPPIKLLEFFTGKYDHNETKTGMKYDTGIARSLSPALANAPVLTQQLVDKFVKHWLATSWKSTTSPSSTTTPTGILNLVIIAGPCGSGKSTVARWLAERFHVPWIEGDGLHDEAALAKMSKNGPLLDEDRWAWLERVKTAAMDASKDTGTVVVTCSALKREYRDFLRGNGEIRTTFFMLQGTVEVLRRRTDRRVGHYMKGEMVESQMDILQEPGVDEVDVIPVDVSGSKEEVGGEVEALFRGVITC